MENSVTDLIIRIKNGYLAKREIIKSPFSKFREEVLKKLVELKFIKKFETVEEKKISIELLYEKGQSALTDVKIYSKPGRRMYVSYKDLKPVLSGYGYSLISTPKGILTDKEAKKNKVGGELLVSFW